MKREDLLAFHDWFSGYVRSFIFPDPKDQRNIELKIVHTRHVCSNILRIAGAHMPDEQDLPTAEATALFHDVGRFPQYARYRTFRDSESVNHGLLGAEVLLDGNILKTLPESEQKLIITSVKFHNTFAIPDTGDGRVRSFLKLVRDADKLDIWRVFTEYFEAPKEERASAVGLGLPDTPECSEKILSSLCEGRLASLSDVRTLNDFKLLQLSWVYDLNFTASFSLLSERGYVGKIASQLPQTEEIGRAISLIHEFIERKKGE